MGVILAVLLLVLLLGAGGFVLHILWVVAVIALIIWLLGFIVRSAEGARWFRW